MMIKSSSNPNLKGLKVVCKQAKVKMDIAKKIFYQEVSVLAKFHHPAIVKFIGYTFDDGNKKGNIYLVEAANGSLEDFINNAQGKQHPLWDHTHKLIIAYGIARVMKYLHSHDILHRDLKPENILLDENLYPLVTDFGTSKAVGDVKTSTTIKETTIKVMAPEFLEDYKKYNRTKPIDVYSYSMVLFRLMTEQLPYTDKRIFNVVSKVMNNQRPEFPQGNVLNEKWKKLICNCWNHDPSKRPTFDEICALLESEFVTSEIDKDLFYSYMEKLVEY